VPKGDQDVTLPAAPSSTDHRSPVPGLASFPIYLLAGGHGSEKHPDTLLRKALALAGRKEPAVAYLGVASGDDEHFFRHISHALLAAGAGAVTLAPLAGRNANIETARHVLSECDLVFISGGDVEEGMRTLRKLHLVEFLSELRQRGMPFAGMSAGSIMLSRAWVHWADPESQDSAVRFNCLGFAPIYCDTHAEDDDWEELNALIRLSEDGAAGYGIPSGGALSVQPDGSVTAYGGAVAVLARRGGEVRREKDLAPEQLRGRA
jgi:peptidase E